MRVAIVRSDIARVYLSDVENRSQRNFSSEPVGQSRYFIKPVDAAILAMLNSYALLSAVGNNASATYNTTSNKTIRIRTKASNSFTQFDVTSDAALPKATLAADLNTGFVNAGLPVRASVVGTNQIQLDTVAPNSGPTAHLELDTNGNGSTLNVAMHSGWPASPPNLDGLSVAALKTAVYPSATTVDVSSATVYALSTWTNLQAVPKAALLAAVQDLIAPKLIETGPVLLSFAYGILSKLRVASFQPGGARAGLPAGIGAAIVTDDGSTAFSL